MRFRTKNSYETFIKTFVTQRFQEKKQEERNWRPLSAACSSFKYSQWYPSISLAHNILFKQCFSCQVTEDLIFFSVWCANLGENVRLWMTEISRANLSKASEIKRDSRIWQNCNKCLSFYSSFFIILSSSPFGHGLVLNSEAKGFRDVYGSCWLLEVLLSVLDTF